MNSCACKVKVRIYRYRRGIYYDPGEWGKSCTWGKKIKKGTEKKWNKRDGKEEKFIIKAYKRTFLSYKFKRKRRDENPKLSHESQETILKSAFSHIIIPENIPFWYCPSYDKYFKIKFKIFFCCSMGRTKWRHGSK